MPVRAGPRLRVSSPLAPSEGRGAAGGARRAGGGKVAAHAVPTSAQAACSMDGKFASLPAERRCWRARPRTCSPAPPPGGSVTSHTTVTSGHAPGTVNCVAGIHAHRVVLPFPRYCSTAELFHTCVRKLSLDERRKQHLCLCSFAGQAGSRA